MGLQWGLGIGLRVKVAAVVVIVLAAGAWMQVRSTHAELSAVYAAEGRATVEAIARTFAGDVDRAQLADRREMQRAVDRLTQINPSLRKASVYALRDGRPVRLATTDALDRFGAVESHDVAPLRSGQASYKTERDGGEHLGELNFPLTDVQGKPFAALGLYFDLAPLDRALAASDQRVALTGAVTGLALVVVLILMLRWLVLRPVLVLRGATRRVAAGGFGERLRWRRRDELGALAADFDVMAAELDATHARLSALATQDSLTALPNHRAFQERLQALSVDASERGESVAVVALDVDRFKSINDRFGHAAGDEALRSAAQAIRSELRPADLCARVGGDEFALALVGADPAGARRVIERVRAAVAAQPVRPGVGMTISAGVAMLGEHVRGPAELLELADGALYRAKREGRDRCAVFSPADPSPMSPEQAASDAQRHALQSTVRALAVAVDAKDGYTHEHSRRVAAYASTLAESFGLGRERVEAIVQAGILHDVGKIAIPESILFKPGKLDDAEYEAMKQHSVIGRDMIANAGLHDVADWVCHLHERVDGHGYPSGLSADAIPFESRILAVADAFEAMTSSRLYRDAMPVEAALEELERAAGAQFDAQVAERFVSLVRTERLHPGATAPVPAAP